jgi:uncharacterized membrane protein YheB (UPF0754 family)
MLNLKGEYLDVVLRIDFLMTFHVVTNRFCFTFVLNIRVLHPAFEEDEIILILVGGVLGLIVGILQVIILY